MPLLLLAVLAVGCWWGSDGRWQPRAGPVKLLPQAGQSTPATRYNGPQCLDASQVGAGQPVADLGPGLRGGRGVAAQERRDVARLFGSETGDRVDKFSRCAWHDGPAGLPILDDAVGWFAGQILNRFDVGDHVGFLLQPVDGHAPERFGELVTFADVRDLEPGHEA